MDKNKRSLSRGILIAIAASFLLLMLVLPLVSVLANALKKGVSFYLSAVSSRYAVSALRVTVIATVASLIINTLFGIMAAWLLTMYTFRGRHVLASLIDIPFSISPVIAGLAFIMTFGRTGWAAPAVSWLNAHLGTDIKLVFSIPGVILATVFVTFPFVSRELVPVLNAQGHDEEEAAALMGAGGLRIFRRITLPRMRWALLYGVILCTARSMGEFGAVNALSKTRGVTFTLPLEIDALYMSGSADAIVRAFAVSSILVILSVLLLVLRTAVEHTANRKERR